ncbi:MAG: polysaccharide biosynthesis tyrosine autokinase [Lachnospiraceae bacterium]|nr:polysaccharide biosynthesis tyrosine autokinase [Lachnospiraceae bacterium]
MAKVEIKIDKLDYESGEAYKTLRTNLQFCGDDKKAIVLTSCTPDEGKSTVVLYLGMSLAEAGKRVLVVDGDLRKSVMMGHFSIPEQVKGLAHFLSGQTYLKDVICETNVKNMDIIFAGPIPPNPAELLGEKQFKEMLKYAREQYDYILIDSPPLGSVIDSAIIAEECDGAVIVIEAEVISYRFVQEIKAQLEKSNCQILGTILNKVDIREQKYYSRYYSRKYGKYYGKYYGYGKYGKK